MAPYAVLALVLSSQPVTSLAVPAWTTVEVKPELATFYSDHVAAALRTRGFKVVTAAEMAGLLSMERQKQLLGCAEDSTSCLAELGSALGVSATLLGNLVRLEDTYHATLKVLRSSDGAVLAEVQVKATGQNALLDELTAAAGRLADRLDAANRPAGEVARRAASVRPWALAPLVLAGLSFAGGAVCLGLAGGRYAALEDALSTSKDVTGAALKLQHDGTTFQLVGWVGLGVGAAALVTAGLMYFLGAEPPAAPVVWLSPSGGGLGLAGSWP